MGRVLAPWGVKGAVKIQRFGANLWKFSEWWVGEPGKHSKVAVTECREHGGYWSRASRVARVRRRQGRTTGPRWP